VRRALILVAAVTIGCSRPGSQADSTEVLVVDTLKPLTGAVVTSPESTVAPSGTTSGTRAGTKASTAAATKSTGTKSATTTTKSADTTRPTVRDSVVRNARQVRIPPDTTKKPPQ